MLHLLFFSQKEIFHTDGTPPKIVFPIFSMTQTPVLGTRTPKGSIVYNPFRRDFLQRSTSLTFSPNVFRSSTPTKKPAGFAWSPEDKGELFPEVIDENPIHQFNLEAHVSCIDPVHFYITCPIECSL